MIHWDSTETPLGILYIAVNNRGIITINYDVPLDRFLGSLKGNNKNVDLSTYISQIDEYFSGLRISFNLPIDISAMTDFRQRVFSHVKTIPYGQTRTYGEVAAALGNPKAARAVGQAMRHNPIPLIIPCHRVVGVNSLGGYGGTEGVPKKRWLLKFEGIQSI